MSKTKDELAPHIDEIKQALKDEKVESHEIETELDTFVNTYGISIQEAKRAVIKKFGGNPRVLSPRRKYRVSDLQNGLFRVDIEGRIISLNKRTYERDGQQRVLFSGIMADDSGKIEFTAWDDFGLEEGGAYKFSNSYTKQWRGRTQLNLGNNTTVEALGDEDLPPLEEITKDSLIDVDRLTRMGGAPGVRVEGFSVGVRNGSGLVFRCPDCNRVLQKKSCMIHGSVEGKADLRIKGIVDDGYGALYYIAGKDVTEGLIEIDLDACKKLASERMDTGAVQEIIEEKIMGKYISITGDVFTDDYGTTMLVNTLDLVERTVTEEAVAMLQELEG
jgi:replication factor A1